MNKHLLRGLAAAAMLVVATAHAATGTASVVISEVDPAGSSSTSGYAADWFELTNTSSSAIDISGWVMADNHAASNTTTPYSGTISLSNLTSTRATFGGAALTLANGATTLAAGQSVVFLESSASAASSASLIASFESAWFGSNVPANLVLGTFNDGASALYGLSQSADMVNIFNSSSALVASVAIGDDGSSTPMTTFDNAAGLNNTTLTLKSVAGVNGAFVSANGAEIGSPAAVPEPAPSAMLFAGLAALGLVVRRRKVEH